MGSSLYTFWVKTPCLPLPFLFCIILDYPIKMTQIVSDSLDIEPFRAMTELQPMQTQSQQYTADSSSDASTSWFINAPGSGALLYNEAYIEYTIKFENAQAAANTHTMEFFFGTTAGNVGDPRKNSTIAFRQGFCMIGAMQAISCNINGTVINEQPDRWSHELFRFYSTPNEQKSICTMSGGEIDEGTCNSLRNEQSNITGAVAATNTIFIGQTFKSNAEADLIGNPLLPSADYSYNPGFHARYMRMAYQFRQNGFDGQASAVQGGIPAGGLNAIWNNTEITLKIFERVPVAPFMLYELRDERRSIPNIDRMELVISWNANARNMFLQGHSSSNVFLDGITGKLVVANTKVSFTNGPTTVPILHLRWYMPPSGFIQQMPREISIPITEIKYDTRTFPSLEHPVANHVSDTIPQTYNNIRLEQIPDMMFIYVKPDPSRMGMEDPSEFHCEITEIDISIDGDSGKLLRMNTAQLFAMYVRNAANRNLTMPRYEEWRKRYCTVALKPEDLGLRHGPGVNHPVTLNVNVRYRSWWNLPFVHHLRAPGNADGLDDLPGNNNNVWQRTDVRHIALNAPAAPGNNRDPQIFIVSEYRRYELTINSAGGSRRKLLALAPPSVSGVPALAPEQIGLAGLV